VLPGVAFLSPARVPTLGVVLLYIYIYIPCHWNSLEMRARGLFLCYCWNWCLLFVLITRLISPSNLPGLVTHGSNCSSANRRAPTAARTWSREGGGIRGGARRALQGPCHKLDARGPGQRCEQTRGRGNAATETQYHRPHDEWERYKAPPTQPTDCLLKCTRCIVMCGAGAELNPLKQAPGRKNS